jgi:hypothetical protein
LSRTSVAVPRAGWLFHFFRAHRHDRSRAATAAVRTGITASTGPDTIASVTAPTAPKPTRPSPKPRRHPGARTRRSRPILARKTPGRGFGDSQNCPLTRARVRSIRRGLRASPPRTGAR